MDLSAVLQGKTFEEAKDFLKKHRLSVKESALNPNLYLVTYHALDGVDWSLTWTRQCRGTILEKNTNKLVCLPFEKFFNAGEKHASEIDWKSALVQEKIDGSLIKVYYYQDRWIVATNGTIDAREALLTVPGSNGLQNFYHLFLQSLGSTLDLSNPLDDHHELLGPKLDSRHVYMFEMLHPISQVVVPVAKPFLYHLGTRDMESFKELPDFILEGIPRPKLFPYLNSLDGCKTLLAETFLSSDDGEGFVVVDSDFRRVKIKSEAYFLQHRARSRKPNIIQTILDGENSEILAYFPHLKEELDLTKKAIDAFKEDFLAACDWTLNFISNETKEGLGDQRALKKNFFLSLTSEQRFKKIKHLILEWEKAHKILESYGSVTVSREENDKFFNDWMRKMMDSKIVQDILEKYMK